MISANKNGRITVHAPNRDKENFLVLTIKTKQKSLIRLEGIEEIEEIE